MVNYQSDPLSQTFQALADPTRRAILARLASGETSIGELAGPFDMSLPAVSKHVKVLENAGLLRRERDGRIHRCHLDPGPMKEVSDWIDHYRQLLGGPVRGARQLPGEAGPKPPGRAEASQETQGGETDDDG